MTSSKQDLGPGPLIEPPHLPIDRRLMVEWLTVLSLYDPPGAALLARRYAALFGDGNLYGFLDNEIAREEATRAVPNM